MARRWHLLVAAAACVALGACDQPSPRPRLQPRIATAPVVAPGTYPESEPIALDRVVVEVFAVGAPGDAKLAGTVTRGIVSAIRSVTPGGVELTMIQSGAIVHPGTSGGPLLDAAGNVAGIAVSAPALRGQTQAGVSYFIPIADALQYLNLKLGQPRELPF